MNIIRLALTILVFSTLACNESETVSLIIEGKLMQKLNSPINDDLYEDHIVIYSFSERSDNEEIIFKPHSMKYQYLKVKLLQYKVVGIHLVSNKESDLPIFVNFEKSNESININEINAELYNQLEQGILFSSAKNKSKRVVHLVMVEKLKNYSYSF